MRTALASGTKLVFGKEQNVIIQEVVGSGASCFVYNATYQDSIGILHNVRIKECYPYNLSLKREENNSLSVLPNEMGKFEKAKAQFIWSYERNANIKRISELLNSTGTVSEIFKANATVYSILSYEEGKDYEQYQDDSLLEVLEHIRAVAQVIQKYHENGYLHLDIKPNNIFIFPETAQHIQLFDFDSVITMEELKKENVYTACSDGFSPPEQWQCKLDSIGKVSDIYALGAVLFYKIFGRVPTAKDGNLDATYDFSNMIYKDDRYQPKLYKGLELLFRKSICTASVARWDNMQLFIEQLERLFPFADPNVIFVQENYCYHSNCFVGRREEIETLQEMLQKKKVVFLSGIGGIGKTELAKRYAYVNKEKYDRIIFVSFCTSIKETICGNDILIQNEALEESSLENLFKTRMKVLKKDLTKNDLFILDNFDVEQEDDLEYLLQCSCKFIITSRNDFRDYNYAQMNVEKIEDEEEILELFFAYNQKEYCYEEWRSIYDIIHLVDNHTMTVELIAKYLRDIEQLPSQLLQKMMEKEGITNLQELKVKHRKDKKMRAESVNSHLLILFQLFHFSEIESELLMSLSLLGYIRILRSSFLEYCNVVQKEENLEHLIKTGWIEYNEKTKKISLHQIILDLVYNYMKPTAENCPNLVEGISNYLLEELKDPVKKENRSKFCRSFMERLSGTSLPYARLCILYGYYLNIPIAERICLASKELEAKNLLYQIYRWKLRKIVVYDDIFISKRNADSNYYENKIKEVLQLTKQALQYAKEYSLDKTYQLKVQAELGKKLNLIANRPFVAMPVEYKQKIKQLLYQRIKKLYEEAEVLILDAELDNKEKIAVLEQILNFYYLGDFSIDLDKFYFYQQMKDRLKEKEGEENDFTDIKLEDVAGKAYLQGEYKKAFIYYKQVLEKGTGSIKNVLEHIMDSWVYKIKISNPSEQDIYPNIKQLFFDFILAIYKNNKVISQDYIKVLLLSSANLRELAKVEKARKQCEKAYILWKKWFPKNVYLKSLIYDGLAESYAVIDNNCIDYSMKLRNNCNYYLIAELDGKGKKITKQLDLWCWAAKKYYDIKKVKRNQMCLEKIIELLEESNDSYDFELTEYWKYIIFLLRGYAKEKKIQKLKNIAIRGYQITINFCCKEKKKEPIEFSKLRVNDIFWNISDIVVVFEENGYEEEAILFFMAAISSIGIGNVLELNQEVLKAVEEGMQGRRKRLINALHKALHGKVVSVQVEHIIVIYEIISPLLHNNMAYMEVKKELEWFLKQYQQQEFEFKREER